MEQQESSQPSAPPRSTTIGRAIAAATVGARRIATNPRVRGEIGWVLAQKTAEFGLQLATLKVLTNLLSQDTFGECQLALTGLLLIAGIGRPTTRPPSGFYRRRMKQQFPYEIYGQRWQVETVFSMIKRRLGVALNARTYWSQCRALMLKVITHNIMIICYVLWGFLQSIPDTIFCPFLSLKALASPGGRGLREWSS